MLFSGKYHQEERYSLHLLCLHAVMIRFLQACHAIIRLDGFKSLEENNKSLTVRVYFPLFIVQFSFIYTRLPESPRARLYLDVRRDIDMDGSTSSVTFQA